MARYLHYGPHTRLIDQITKPLPLPMAEEASDSYPGDNTIIEQNGLYVVWSVAVVEVTSDSR